MRQIRVGEAGGYNSSSSSGETSEETSRDNELGEKSDTGNETGETIRIFREDEGDNGEEIGSSNATIEESTNHSIASEADRLSKVPKQGYPARRETSKNCHSTDERREGTQRGAEFSRLSPFKRNNFPLFIGLETLSFFAWIFGQKN